MPADRLSNFILLPELKLLRIVQENSYRARYECEKVPGLVEYCPRCAQPSQAIYDRRWVSIKDAPIRGTSSNCPTLTDHRRQLSPSEG